MGILRSVLLGSACIGALNFAPHAACAQEEQSGQDVQARGLDTVIVTARRREENLQKVPVSVQSFESSTLEALSIDNSTDLTRLVPALTTSQSSRDEENYVMRGQSGSGASITGQQVTVTPYFAEVPLPIGDGGGAGRYFDLQSVQVLKGPQGTLFGRNATGGAILFQPRLPGDTPGGYLQVEYGSFDHAVAEGAINLPVSDILKVRVAGRMNKRDGFTKNITIGGKQDNRDNWAGRVTAVLTPTESLENIFVFDYLDRDNNGASNHITAVNSMAGIPSFLGGAVENALALKESVGPRVSITNLPTRNQLVSWGISNITTYDLGNDLALKNVFGLRRLRSLNQWDYDGSNLPLLEFDACVTPATCNSFDDTNPWTVNVRQITNEIQLNGSLLERRLDFTIGGFYLTNTSPESNYLHRSIGVFGLTTDINQFIDDTSKAVFGQATLDLSDWVLQGLRATAGYRWSDDERQLELYQVDNGRCTVGDVGAPAPDPAEAYHCSVTVKSAAKSDSYTFGLDYQVFDNTMIYATHRRSYRAGGYNPLAAPALTAMPPIPNAEGLFSYAPEVVTDWEIGFKADWSLGGVDLRTNFSYYISDLEDAQINQTFTGGGGVTVSAVTNAATADINGFDFDAIVAPNEYVTIVFGYARTKAEYGPFQDYTRRDPVTGEPSLQEGRVFPFTPENKLNLMLSLKAPLDEHHGEIVATANWAYKSSMILGLVPFITLPDGTNIFDGESRVGSTNTIDFDVRWSGLLGTGLDASIFVTNAANTVYKESGASLINSGLGFNQRNYNEPRMWGVRLRYNVGG